MKSVFEKLCSLVPLDSNKQISDDNTEMDSMRKDIIQYSRFILINNLFPNRMILPFSSPDKEMIIQKSSMYYPAIGVSQIGQAANFVFSYLYENLPVLVEIFTKIAKRPNTASIAFNLIPGLFGYFSSQEFLEFAEKFYFSLIDEFKPDVRSLFPFLIPFFRCSAVYRFIESASSIFFQRFMIDISDPKRKVFSFLIPIHAAFLLDCFSNTLYQLPMPHINILRELLKISDEQVFLDFILDEFFSPLTLAWLKSAAVPSDTPFFEKILLEMRNKKDELQNLYQNIRTVTTVFHLPRFFEGCQYESYTLYYKVSNIIDLVRIMNENNLLPPHISISEFSNIDESLYDELFWCQLFSQKHCKSIQVLTPIIFKNTKRYELPEIENKEAYEKRLQQIMLSGRIHLQNPFVYTAKQIEKNDPKQYGLIYLTNELLNIADTFEQFLIQHVFLTQLKEWRSTLSSFMSSFVMRRIEFLFLSKKMTYNDLTQLRLAYNQPFHNKLYYLFSLDYYIQKIYQTYGERLNALEEKWDSTIKTIISKQLMQSFAQFITQQKETASHAIWDSIKILRCTWKLAYHHRYLHIIKALQIIDTIVGLKNKTISIILQQIKGNIIIPSFIILNSCCLSSSVFLQYLEDTEQRNWVHYEASILSIIGIDETFLSEFLAIQQEIKDKYRPKIKELFTSS